MTATEKKALLATGLFLCALLPFAASVSFDALNFDDFEYAARNEIVLKGFSWQGLPYAFAGTHDLGIWFPLTIFTYQCDVVCFGGTPQAFHLGNLLWHGAAAVALFLLLVEVMKLRLADRIHRISQDGRADFSNPVSSCESCQKTPGNANKPAHSIGDAETIGLWCAFFAALFWAVHPLRTESVAWIASRKDLVSGCFGFLGLACYVRACVSIASVKPYWAAILCFALAIMAKPVVMTFPIAAVCLEAMLTGKIRWRRLVLPFCMAIACGLLAIWMQTDEHQTMGSLMATSVWARLFNAMDSIWHYVRATVWPSGLACFYPWPQTIAWGGAVMGILFSGAVACLSAMALWNFRQRRNLECGGLTPLFSSEASLAASTSNLDRIHRMKPDWQRQPDNPVSSCESCQKTLQSCACLGIWFLAALAPMLSIIQFGKHACADRFTYWPSAAVAVGLALTLQFGVRRLDAAFSRRVTPLMLGVAAILCLCYGSVARQTTQYWRNTVTMWERACAVTHNNAFAHAVLGMTYAVEPARLGEAVRQLEISIQLLPNSENIGSLALLLATRAPDAQLDRAVALAHQALDISAAEGTAQVALGLVALRRKDWPEAERLLAAGAAARSDNPMTWEWLGMARYNLKDYAGASDAFRKSLHLSPGNTSLAERIRQAEKLNQEK